MDADSSFTLDHLGRRLSISARVRLASDDLILFMHGFGCAKACFAEAFRDETLRDFSLCAFDFPSHGSSDPLPREGSSLQTYADIACALVNKIAPARVFMVCHSMGGGVGVIAAQELTNLAGLVNVEGNLIGRDCGLVSRRIADEAPADFEVQGFGRFADELQLSPRADLRTWGRWYTNCDPSGLHGIARSLVEWSDSDKLLDMFLRIPCRAYVHGSDSQLGYLFPKLLATPTYSVSKASHFPMLDNPPEFYGLLGRLLSALSHSELVAPGIGIQP